MNTMNLDIWHTVLFFTYSSDVYDFRCSPGFLSYCSNSFICWLVPSMPCFLPHLASAFMFPWFDCVSCIPELQSVLFSLNKHCFTVKLTLFAWTYPLQNGPFNDQALRNLSNYSLKTLSQNSEMDYNICVE